MSALAVSLMTKWEFEQLAWEGRLAATIVVIFSVKNRFDNSFFFISELALGDQVTGIAGLKTQLQVSVL